MAMIAMRTAHHERRNDGSIRDKLERQDRQSCCDDHQAHQAMAFAFSSTAFRLRVRLSSGWIQLSGNSPLRSRVLPYCQVYCSLELLPSSSTIGTSNNLSAINCATRDHGWKGSGSLIHHRYCCVSRYSELVPCRICKGFSVHPLSCRLYRVVIPSSFPPELHKMSPSKSSPNSWGSGLSTTSLHSSLMRPMFASGPAIRLSLMRRCLSDE